MKLIIELLDRLRDELESSQRMSFSELKEKVDVITEEYPDMANDITLNLFDFKKINNLISRIKELANHERKLKYEEMFLIRNKTYNLFSYLEIGEGGTIENDFEDATPYPEYIVGMAKDICDDLRKIEENELSILQQQKNATKRTGSNT